MCTRKGRHMKRNYQRWTIVAAFGASLTVLPVSGCAAPTVAENRLETLRIKPGPKKVVAIYEFRSSVAGVSVASAVDMFTTALVKANAFAVAERARLDQAVTKEKDLQTSGRATGSAGSRKLTGADYVFEATVSESNPGEKASSGGVSLGGLSVGGAGVADSIGPDVP